MTKKFDYLLISNGVKQYKISNEAFNLNKKLNVNLDDIKFFTHHKNYITTFDIKNIKNPKRLNFKKLKKIKNIVKENINDNLNEKIVNLDGNSYNLNKNTIPHYYLKKTINVENLIEFYKKIGYEDFSKIYPLHIANLFSNMFKKYEDLNQVFINNKLYRNKNPHFKLNFVEVNKSYWFSHKDNFKKILNREALNSNNNHIDCILEISIFQNLKVKNMLPILKQKQNLNLSISSINNKNFNLCCSFDHRIIDGAKGAKILNEIEFSFKNPVLSLI